MTLAGVMRAWEGGVVLFADRQETISDYAKWEQGKIRVYELWGAFRVLIAASGPSNTCDMIWDEVMESLGKNKLTGQRAIRNCIVQTVFRVTKRNILPFPHKDRPLVDAIWVVQSMEGPGPRGNPYATIDTFRTCGLDENNIGKFYFTGTPILLTKFLSDMFLEGIQFSLDEAEALAAYFLWEAGEYDPFVGKHGDILLVRKDETLGRLSREGEKYWREHFETLKESLRLLPLLSCATTKISNLDAFDMRENLERLRTTVKTLSVEQLRWRKKMQKPRSRLEKRLMANIERVAKKHAARREAEVMRLVSRTSKQVP